MLEYEANDIRMIWIIREGHGESAFLAIVCAANLQGVLCIHSPNGRVWFQEGEGLGKEEKGLATPWLAASSCLRNLHEIRFWGRFILFWGGCVPTPPMCIPWFCSSYLISCHDWRNPRLGHRRLWVDPREGRSLPLRAGGFGLKDVKKAPCSAAQQKLEDITHHHTHAP